MARTLKIDITESAEELLEQLKKSDNQDDSMKSYSFDAIVGIVLELIVVSISGFCSIYFEKVIKSPSPKNMIAMNSRRSMAKSLEFGNGTSS